MVNSQTINYLKIVPFSQFSLWDTKRYTSKLISSNYSIVKLGTCIVEQSKKYKIFEQKEVDFGILGVNNKEGIFDAYTQKGAEINQPYKKMERGWLAYNPYRINVGSIGIKLVEHQNEYISPAYVVFSCKENLLPEFLFFLFKTNTFNNVIKESTTGSVRQNLTFETLRSLEIPLPSIEEQTRIVAAYNAKLQSAQVQVLQSKQLEIDIEKYLLEELGVQEKKDLKSKKLFKTINYSKLDKWAISHLSKDDVFDFKNAKYTTEKIKNLLAFFEGGKTPSKARSDFWNGEIYWTSPKDFDGQYIDIAEDKITLNAVKEAGMKVHPKGVFLSVFRSGILQHSFPTAITNIETSINQDLKAYSFKEELIDKYYYLHFVHVFKKYILLKASKKSVTVESINTEDFFEIQIPIPPLKKQKEISQKINFLKNQLTELNSSSINNKTEAILDFEKEVFN
ncbi:restriction endonuclease subunit S [Flavobacterium sp. LM4]|uniref:restriction endonuclease subunit S n=1 Tax=Flavobacterium sp. LM4 TaxID=1938609 RepID=UPI00099238A2|nr:restriction endonuclease subunit S [Flavobacterium sp. LM4]OOV17324.1 hypothetical protein BXU10_14555 [Flavobacterium sp. LM4]